MLLSFMIDQVQGIACAFFQAIKKQAGSFRTLWEKTRVLFEYVELASWEYLYRFMIERRKIDTS
jgi:hypothetical protein